VVPTWWRRVNAAAVLPRSFSAIDAASSRSRPMTGMWSTVTSACAGVMPSLQAVLAEDGEVVVQRAGVRGKIAAIAEPAATASVRFSPPLSIKPSHLGKQVSPNRARRFHGQTWQRGRRAHEALSALTARTASRSSATCSRTCAYVCLLARWASIRI